MKKILSATIIALMVTSAAFAEGTYSEGLLNSFNKKVNDAAAPVVNKEKQIKAQQTALNPQNKVSDVQKQQQDLINKKKQQVQAQKNLLDNEKNELKGLFTIK